MGRHLHQIWSNTLTGEGHFSTKLAMVYAPGSSIVGTSHLLPGCVGTLFSVDTIVLVVAECSVVFLMCMI